MRKFIMGLFTLIVCIFTVSFFITANNKSQESVDFITKPPLVGEQLYLSNRFTLPESNVTYVYDLVIPDGYEKIAENSKYELYLNKTKVVFKVKDLTTGYIWSSALDQTLTRDEIEVAKYANTALSSFSIEYFEYNSELNDHTGGYVETKKDAFLYFSTIPNSRNDRTIKSRRLDEDVVTTYTNIENGVKVNLDFINIKIGFDVDVTLNEDGLHVHIPNESIVESENKLATINVMPFLGSTITDQVPGYMFIPDGSGALIRYKNNGEAKINAFTARFYGVNHGITNVLVEPYKTESLFLTAPVFGAIHGVDQNGVIGIIESGSYNAELNINSNGALGTKFNWITPSYLIRENYNLYKVNKTFEAEKNPEDITVSYQFLQNKDANYVGMAKAYQANLVKDNVLSKQINNQTPLRLEILASETTSGLFGPKVETMTTIAKSKEFINDLTSHDVDDLLVVMRGWNKGGLSGTSPYSINYEGKVGSNSEFKDFINDLKLQNIPVYFYNDYVIGYSSTDRISLRTDIAKSLQRVQMEFLTPKEPVYDKYYYLYPNASLNLAKDDLSAYDKRGIENLAIDSIGHTIFSYYNKGIDYKRVDSVSKYKELLNTLNRNVSMYKPNAYMWQYSENYFDMPMFSSQYTYYSDSVPFLQIVLKGYMNYYAPFSNFSATSKEQLLLMIDYGMLPSFIVTDKPSYNLKYTNSYEFYTTQYSDMKKLIIDQYQKINIHLQKLKNETLESREILEAGVVKVTYSNRNVVIINYTNSDFDYNGFIISPKDFKMIGGN
ncbi:MAG: hypothetical protein K0Q49_481 [Haloplasmataceae bacterium]|jgi:hypothetical protein|nr:hypothetical protein [Haloplasmataceae bacterium]